MSLCLYCDELAEVTRTRLKRKQVEFLVRNGIRHYVDAHGWPVVTRAAIGIGSEVETKIAPKPWHPNKAID
ncbi:DUF4224 domain-containing protein [Dyella nitratireducens]|uniref:DUF4224 domain-containing protein n=1 Tax=Dyella nitratireducens TaxID=1849580 RepID=A0ABQ1FUS4_9GAMM|nr:DUF4224 domain-containing protein [Dyella nitratireducens]GGA28728.1 hypothetical protein GCM10010981_16930 [Dyella nitratireducens]GLQ43242.1 hypothetical protein GCM10007902_30920 [Dyella nitratireducens]